MKIDSNGLFYTVLTVLTPFPLKIFEIIPNSIYPILALASLAVSVIILAYNRIRKTNHDLWKSFLIFSAVFTLFWLFWQPKTANVQLERTYDIDFESVDLDLVRKADAGDLFAQTYLGYKLTNGIDIFFDHEFSYVDADKGREYLLEAANGGYDGAYYCLGKIEELGIGGKKHHSLAFEHYLKAIEINPDYQAAWDAINGLELKPYEQAKLAATREYYDSVKLRESEAKSRIREQTSSAAPDDHTEYISDNITFNRLQTNIDSIVRNSSTQDLKVVDFCVENHDLDLDSLYKYCIELELLRRSYLSGEISREKFDGCKEKVNYRKNAYVASLKPIIETKIHTDTCEYSNLNIHYIDPQTHNYNIKVDPQTHNYNNIDPQTHNYNIKVETQRTIFD